MLKCRRHHFSCRSAVNYQPCCDRQLAETRFMSFATADENCLNERYLMSPSQSSQIPVSIQYVERFFAVIRLILRRCRTSDVDLWTTADALTAHAILNSQFQNFGLLTSLSSLPISCRLSESCAVLITPDHPQASAATATTAAAAAAAAATVFVSLPLT